MRKECEALGEYRSTLRGVSFKCELLSDRTYKM